MDIKDGITIGPLVDGGFYTYDRKSKAWYVDGETVDELPYEILEEENGRRWPYLFHTRTHKWLDQHRIILSNSESQQIDKKFRDRYGLNGKVRLFDLDKKFDRTPKPDEYSTGAGLVEMLRENASSQGGPPVNLHDALSEMQRYDR